MISKQEVEHIAKLARLELTENEIEKMQKDLSAILDYFDLLKKAPKPETAQILLEQKTCSGGLRKDEVERSDIASGIIEASPDKKDGYIKVKTIL
ncbi:MAG: Asp-tRNA(Asn)/Glu-tRNA(Gln) amidotransferase subunit GatC [Candidatus Staskawiczbacteria bacterium]|nr:Asp-tRNA(Asn)/Glu-tRNA(Gln) amidotransferase subunit GatC [Candidatus Staskawiczbacteria bacterium]